MSRTYASLLVLTFCALLALPGATLLIWRQPQQLPKVAEVTCPPFQPTLEWLAAAEKYFIANFGLKRRLVQLHNIIGYRVVGDLQSNSVLAGRAGWLERQPDRLERVVRGTLAGCGGLGVGGHWRFNPQSSRLMFVSDRSR